jgi:hypothetical protein
MLHGNAWSVAISYVETCSLTGETFQVYMERLQCELKVRVEYFGYTKDDRRLAALIVEWPTTKKELLEYLQTSDDYVVMPESLATA